MLTSIRGLVAATLMAGTALAAAPAFAQEEEAKDITISGNAAIVSEYRFRGVDLSGGDVAIQGGLDISHKSGIYVGTWGSSIDEDSVGFGHTEIDLYGGWTGELTSGLTGDIGVIYYAYPNAGPGSFDYVEFYSSLAFAFGPAETTVGVAYAPDQSSLGSTDNLYLYTDLAVGIPNTPLTVKGHLGYTDGFLTFTPNGKAFDWSVGADFAVNDNVSIGLSYIDAEGTHAPLAYKFTDSAVVGTLSVSF